MTNREYGLEFTYHSGYSDDEYYPSEEKRNTVFKAWAKRLNTKGYTHSTVKSVRKIQK